MKKGFKKGIRNMTSKALIALLVLSFIFSFLIPIGYGLWNFADFSINRSKDISFNVDRSNYNVNKKILETKDISEIYDVYFLAQHINILEQYIDENNILQYRYLEEDINGNFSFKDETDSHGLFYITPEVDKANGRSIVNRVTSFDPRLGCWNNSLTGEAGLEILVEGNRYVCNVYQKYEDVSHLTADVIESIGKPKFDLVDGNNWPLSFLSWTLDYIENEYKTTYYTDSGRFGNTAPSKKWALPIEVGWTKTEYSYALYDEDTDSYPTADVYAEASLSSLYTRQDTAISNSGSFKTYGMYPNNNFEVAHLSTLLQNYEDHAIIIDGRKCLFFLPIYSDAKDYQYNVVRKEYEKLEDCIRIRSNDDDTTDLYTTFDCEMTECLNASTTMQNNIVMWGLTDAECDSKGLPHGTMQGFEKINESYKCFRISNRVVTKDMVTKNQEAENLEVPLDFVRKQSKGSNALTCLTTEQEYQLGFGDYIFSDLARTGKSYDGINFSYLKDELDGSLLNINYKEGLFNIYIFVRECYCDNPADRNNYYHNDYTFSNEQVLEINSILSSKNINVDKTVRCEAFTEFNSSGWSQNDFRCYYVVFEEIITPIAILQYGGGDSTKILDFTKESTLAGSYMSAVAIETNVDEYVDEAFNPITNRKGYVSTTKALVDLDGNPLTMTYPYYYMSIKIAGEDSIIKQSAGKSASSPNYEDPYYKFKVNDYTFINKAFKGNELIQTISESMQNVSERERVKVYLNDKAYSLESLKLIHDKVLESINDGNNKSYLLSEGDLSIINNSEDITIEVDSINITSLFMNESNDLYLSIMEQLEDVGLNKARSTGTYRVCLVLYKNVLEEYEADIWLVDPSTTVVTIYDSRDYSDLSVSKDIDGIFTSREWATENFTFIANYIYEENAYLVRGNDANDGVKVRFNYNGDLIPSSSLDSILTSSGSLKYVNLDDLLYYYEYVEATPKCLFDRSTGRYITYDNWSTIPYRVHGDIIFEVVDIPEEFLN